METLCKERCLFEIIRGPSIASFIDVLAFYNIIEIESSKVGTGKADSKKDNKLSRFHLKVEYNELEHELDKLLQEQRDDQ